MRDIALSILFIPMLLGSMRYLHTATMTWFWTALATPSAFMFGPLATMPLNKIAVAGTVISLVLDKTKRKFLADPGFVFHTLFIVQGLISFAFSLTDIPRCYDLIDKMVKIWALCCFMRMANRERLHLHAYFMMLALCVGLQGILEGLKYILSAGSHKVQVTGAFGDNNSMAMAVLMVLPFFLYVFQYSSKIIVRLVFAGLGMLAIVGVIASSSRGAVIGLIVLAGMMIMQSRRKAMGLMIAASLGVAVVSLAPDRWLGRMETIQDAESDGSFMGRVISWKMNTIVALNRPFTGGGFSALEDRRVHQQILPEFGMLDFIPTSYPASVLAAHSIYFEVLGDTGFSGLFLFLSILASWYLNLRHVKRLTRASQEQRWAYDLAIAIERSLVVYLVTGAALSAAYFENVYIEMTLAGMLYSFVRETTGAHFNRGASYLQFQPTAAPVSWARR
jgi:probable O-glycosylation ligase (exosortase A-associated)